MIKGAEPLLAVVISKLFFKSNNLSAAEAVAITTVSVGVMLTASEDKDFLFVPA